MRLIDPLLMEFDREASTTRKLLERLPEGKLSWAPHPKSYTLARLGKHLATLPAWIAGTLLADGFDLGAAPPLGEPPTTTAEIVGAFDENVGKAKAAMAQLDDARATAAWTLSLNGRPLLQMPRIAFVRTLLLNHSVHHRGQLSVYLRLLDVPVPPMYGPTADENPFR
jgi:uncharacterized damage-inducible protein DinB